jgi:hypothetical protein
MKRPAAPGRATLAYPLFLRPLPSPHVIIISGKCARHTHEFPHRARLHPNAILQRRKFFASARIIKQRRNEFSFSLLRDSGKNHHAPLFSLTPELMNTFFSAVQPNYVLCPEEKFVLQRRVRRMCVSLIVITRFQEEAECENGERALLCARHRLSHCT